MSELPDGVKFGTGEGDLPVVDIDTTRARARIYLYGAHITEWTPAGSEPVLWLSPASFFAEGSPIRGGIPICLPWFSKGPNGDLEPMHGVARLTEWDLVEASEADGNVTLHLQLRMEDWSASLIIGIGTTLTLELTTTNHGDGRMMLEEAFHTYFRVSDVANVRVNGLDGASYLDKVAGGTAVQQGDVIFTDRTDRVYESDSGVAIIDPGRGRRIEISKQNSPHTVVWNPWSETTKAMADIPDESWPAFVCVETASVGAFAAALAPGESRTMATSYRVDPL